MQRAVDLATRQAGSIEVALLYDRVDRTLAVFVHDAMTGEELCLPVNGAEASEVYRHPYGYAHRAQTRRRRAGHGGSGWVSSA